MIVFVIDNEGKPLLPTHPARARKLLNQNKAMVKQVVPFTIQLTNTIANPVGEFEVGIDDGAKHVGIAIKNNLTNQIVFRGQLDHRQDVSRKVEQRKNYRRSRRSRKLRYRQPRFKNRIRKNRIAPSIRQRKEAIIRVLNDFRKILNLVKVIVEEVKFNHAKHSWGRNFSLVEIGKTYLREEIIKLGLFYETTFGYDTKPKRLGLGLSKKHSNDACAIVNSNKTIDREYFIKPRRTKVWENNPTKTCVEKNGFCHYDLVKSIHKKRGTVIGSIRSLKENQISLRTKFNENFSVNYRKTKLLYRFSGLIYSW